MLKIRKVEVLPYNPNWQVLFEKEAEQIKEVFGDLLLEIHHIGSTSVVGLPAKPIIDIMPVVKNIEQVDLFNDKMLALGYEAMGEFGISGRRYFRKGKDERTHHVHIFEEGDQNIHRHLAFRNYLRKYPEIAEEYGLLKQKLANRFPNDIEAYMNGKNSFIKKIESKASIEFTAGKS